MDKTVYQKNLKKMYNSFELKKSVKLWTSQVLKNETYVTMTTTQC